MIQIKLQQAQVCIHVQNICSSSGSAVKFWKVHNQHDIHTDEQECSLKKQSKIAQPAHIKNPGIVLA